MAQIDRPRRVWRGVRGVRGLCAVGHRPRDRCRNHARRIAVSEARRMAGCDLSMPHVDVESRARGPELHLSLSVEAQRRNP